VYDTRTRSIGEDRVFGVIGLGTVYRISLSGTKNNKSQRLKILFKPRGGKPGWRASGEEAA